MATTTDSLKYYSSKTLNTTESFLTKSMSVFGNNYVKNIALVVLLLYAPAAAPAIGPAVGALLQNYAIKLIYVFVLAYLLSGSIRVSVLTAVVIILGIFLLKKFRSEHFEGNMKNEKKHINDVPIGFHRMPDGTIMSDDAHRMEPYINRFELTKTGCDVSGNFEPHMIDNTTEYNAMANHADALHPEYLKNMKTVETDTTVDGYDESVNSNSEY